MSLFCLLPHFAFSAIRMKELQLLPLPQPVSPPGHAPKSAQWSQRSFVAMDTPKADLLGLNNQSCLVDFNLQDRAIPQKATKEG